MQGTSVRRSVRVLVVDDHQLFAEGLIQLLGVEDRLEVVGHARNGWEAVGLTLSLEPDLVLMDVSMPGMDGIEATRRICTLRPQTSVLVLTGSTGPEGARAAADAGAAGYLTKTVASSDLVSTILEVAALAALGRPQRAAAWGRGNLS